MLRAMTVLGRMLLLAAAGFLCVGSAKSGPGARQSRGLQKKKDAQLRHPALQVVNRSAEVVKLAFHGPVRRVVIAPPQEQARTLLAAGEYKLEVRRGGRLLRREKVRLQKGHRYRLEIAP
jgi:hypothetical protein